LVMAAASLFSPPASAQELAAPTDLKAESALGGIIRLTWTAPPGSGNRFLIERSGPGLTFYTQVAGPISETSYVVDAKTHGLEAGQVYTFRVRAVDAASTKGPPSATVSAGVRPKELPLVGTNVLQLLSLLPGTAAANDQYPACTSLLRVDQPLNCRLPRLSSQPDSISFLLKDTVDRTVSFQSEDGTFSWTCPKCEFAVSATGIGPATGSDPSITFKLSEDGSQLLVTCRAINCDLLIARAMEVENNIYRASGDITRHRLTLDEATKISASQRVLLTVSRNRP
jgi:hypothetical protein